MFSENSSPFSSFSRPQLPHLCRRNRCLSASLSPVSGTRAALSATRWGLKASPSRRGRTCALTGAVPRLPTLCVRHFRREPPGRRGRECGSVLCALPDEAPAADRPALRPVAGPVSAREPVCPGSRGEGPLRGRDDRKWGTRVEKETPGNRDPWGRGDNRKWGASKGCRRDLGALGFRERWIPDFFLGEGGEEDDARKNVRLQVRKIPGFPLTNGVCTHLCAHPTIPSPD